jgi:hypothetical protein
LSPKVVARPDTFNFSLRFLESCKVECCRCLLLAGLVRG